MNRIRILAYRLFGIRYPVRRIQSFRMILDLEDPGISMQLLQYEVREPDHKFLYEEELRPGMTVLDCGANIGYYALMAAKLVGRDGKVIAIEPSPYNFHLLNLNIRLNGLERMFRVFQVGASNKSGEEELHLSEHSNLHTFYPKGSGLTYTHSIQIPMTTLSDLAREHGRFELVRMDTEGYEVQILEGLLPALDDAGFGPMILFETHPASYSADHDLRKPMRALFEAGYHVKYVVVNDYHAGTAEAYREKGYGDDHVVAVFRANCDRAIYVNVSDEDALEFAHTERVRALMLARRGVKAASGGS